MPCRFDHATIHLNTFFQRPATRAMRSLLTICMILLSALLCAGCMGVKKVPLPEDTSPEPLGRLTAEDSPRIGFYGLVSGIKRGQVVGAFYNGRSFDGGELCNYPRGGEMIWATAQKGLSGNDSEISERFYEALSEEGYNVVGDPSIIFDRAQSLMSARYKVAARITDMTANICNECSTWDGTPLGTSSGEMHLTIEWTVKDVLNERVLFMCKTSGYAKQTSGMHDAVDFLIGEAFQDAAYDLANTKTFRDVVTVAEVIPKTPEKSINLCLTHRSPGKFTEKTTDIISSVVTIFTGPGHGSGFAITDDGYFLTNNHVVEGFEDVYVELARGIRIPGKVVAVNKIRDVALVKADANFPPVAISQKPVKLTQQVYCVGTPLYRELDHTVTSGIVSAFRKIGAHRLPLIQADVDAQPGNSGGALFNEDGEVVAITVMMCSQTGNSVGLNLFIPIQEGLKGLGITDICN